LFQKELIPVYSHPGPLNPAIRLKRLSMAWNICMDITPDFADVRRGPFEIAVTTAGELAVVLIVLFCTLCRYQSFYHYNEKQGIHFSGDYLFLPGFSRDKLLSNSY
jgi:hypothetical protein